MKKLLFAAILVAGAVALMAPRAVAQVKVYNTVISSYAATATTTTPTCLAVPIAYAWARICKIDVTWNPSASTNTVYLYDKVGKVGNSQAPRLLYKVKLGTGTTNPHVQIDFPPGAPLCAVDGVQAITDEVTVGLPVTNVSYW